MQKKIPTISSPKTLGIILSGGAGRRFDGLDKGLQVYKGKPLIQWVIEALAPQVQETILCINRHEQSYKQFCQKTVFDSEADHQGPLAGVIAALNSIDQPCFYSDVLISSCDTPLLPLGYGNVLRDFLEKTKSNVAVVNDGKRNQNLHCLIRFSAINSLFDFYHGGGRAMHRWHQSAGAVYVDFSDQADRFLNINSAAQLL